MAEWGATRVVRIEDIEWIETADNQLRGAAHGGRAAAAAADAWADRLSCSVAQGVRRRGSHSVTDAISRVSGNP